MHAHLNIALNTLVLTYTNMIRYFLSQGIYHNLIVRKPLDKFSYPIHEWTETIFLALASAKI